MGGPLQELEPVRGRLAREISRRARDLDQRELQRQPRVAALAHVLDRHGEQVAEPQHRRLADLVRLLAQPLARLLRDRQRLRHLAQVLDEQQVAQVLEQVGYEPPEVLSLLGELLDEGQRAGRVAVDDQVAEPEERLLLDRAEQLQHRLHRDLVLRRGSELVQRRDRVAVGAAGRARDQRQRSVGRLDPLAVCDASQNLHELRQPRPREDERLAARADGREHLPEVGRAEDEDEVWRRLLDQLQQRVEGGVRELVRLVEDVDLVAALDRLQHDALADLADVVDPALRGRVHLDHVERGAVGDRAACVAGLVRRRCRPVLAVQRLGEDARQRGLAGSARAREEVGLADLLVRDRVLQRPGDRFLADDLVEVLRAVLAVQGGHATTLPNLRPGTPRA